jgi:hypothetical protein
MDIDIKVRIISYWARLLTGKQSFFENNVHILSSLSILHQHPHSIGNIWFVSLNLPRVAKSLSFKIKNKYDLNKLCRFAAIINKGVLTELLPTCTYIM